MRTGFTGRLVVLCALLGALALVAGASAAEVELPGGDPTPEPGDRPVGAVAETTTTKAVVPLRTLHMGSRGDYVEDLQRALHKRGIRVKPDGVYGRGTRRGVRIVQKRLKLRPTGVAKTGFQRRMGIRPRRLEITVSVALVTQVTIDLVRPVKGAITSGFGRRGSRLHAGVDIPGEPGTPILAAAAGTVTRAGWQSGYGRRVVINHGRGIATVYAHLADLAVTKGQMIGHDTTVGSMGATGRTTAVHLHFELRFRGRAVNPVPYF